MPINDLNLGTTSNNGTGDPLRIGGQKINANFAFLKAYVDNLLQGWKWKNKVACATTANITLSGEQTIDGVTTSASRVLVKNQTDATENGIYISDAGAWSRATDADTGEELVNATVSVVSGTENELTNWTCNVESITLGSTDITFVEFEAGTGVSQSVFDAAIAALNDEIDSKVDSVTGDGVNNDDPNNPVLSFPDADEVDDSATTNKFVTQTEKDKLTNVPNDTNAALSGKSGTDHTHTKSDITDFNEGDYAADSHTHTKSDITDFNDADYEPALGYTPANDSEVVKTISTNGGTPQEPDASGNSDITVETFSATENEHGQHPAFTSQNDAIIWLLGNAVGEPENTAPTISGVPDETKTEGYSSFTVELAQYASDADSDSLTYSASSADTNLATVSVSGSTLTVTEVSGTGTVDITVTVDDGLATGQDIFTLTVNSTAEQLNALSNMTADSGGGDSHIINWQDTNS